ncbi:sensor domain-containing diguanylate cyclase [Geosporobacter ferrireducens]|uniref:sensor domain-containing diguanylate cyclase n=1 Tax=Geosporobacter ferrireducens TaxID=1424294 RepID=UPI00139ADD47|nr:sensor domain-containing diguanylate cyclase [Geosporobacter ferrireducens]MTI55357.1 diguanylate cyclase [Geosporobacter ferrireducens]
MFLRNHLIHGRNRLLLTYISVLYLANFSLNLLIYRNFSIVSLSMGVIFAAILFILVRNKKRPVLTMYFMICFLFCFTFFLTLTHLSLVSYMLFWLAVILSALYLERGIIVLSGFLKGLATLYFFNKYQLQIFPGADPQSLAFLLLFDAFLIIFLLIVTAVFKKLLDKAEEGQQQLNSILNNTDVVTWSLNLQTGRMLFSPNIEKLSGRSPEYFIKNKEGWRSIIHPSDLSYASKEMHKQLLGDMKPVEYRIVTMNGEDRWVQSRGSLVKDESNKLIRIDGVLIDITPQKKLEDKMIQMALHDPLTGLPNRVHFNNRVTEALERVKRKKQQMSIFFIDLDGFKKINDTYGHDVGDVVLKDVAERLRAIFRENDILCRIGGDEFMVLLEITSIQHAEKAAKRILEELASPFQFQERSIYVSPSIGISIYPMDGLDIESLIKKADDAMYAVKKKGKNNYQFYSIHTA